MQAMRAHVTGTLLVASIVLIGLWFVATAVGGWQLGLPSTAKAGLFVATLVVAALFEWIVRLAIERFG
jgi:hypothetical protein